MATFRFYSYGGNAISSGENNRTGDSGVIAYLAYTLLLAFCTCLAGRRLSGGWRSDWREAVASNTCAATLRMCFSRITLIYHHGAHNAGMGAHNKHQHHGNSGLGISYGA